ncbi:MAG: GAF domain-containing protein [Candidatus Kariarchaeaceae archaeon]|jgi:GAF domain-containing protein
MRSELKKERYQEIITNLYSSINSEEISSVSKLYKKIVAELSNIPYYHWTGVYLLDEDNQELILDNYIGAETEHTVIPVGTGVCGSAVAEKTDKIIHDVREESNYLACSLGTRSEIVVLIEDENKIFGQIDIDSDEVGAFDEVDQKYLRQISEMIVKKLTTL